MNSKSENLFKTCYFIMWHLCISTTNSYFHKLLDYVVGVSRGFHQRCQERRQKRKEKRWRETTILQVATVKKGQCWVAEVHGKCGIKIGQGAPRAQSPSGGAQSMMCWGPNPSMILGGNREEWLLPGAPMHLMWSVAMAMRFASSSSSLPPVLQYEYFLLFYFTLNFHISSSLMSLPKLNVLLLLSFFYFFYNN